LFAQRLAVDFAVQWYQRQKNGAGSSHLA
jgi:hypothetical protein